MVSLAFSLPVTRAALTAGGNEIWKEKAYPPGMSAIAVGVVTAMLARRIQVPSRRVVWVMGLVGWAGVCAVLFAGSWVWKFLHHGYGLFLAVAAAGIVLSTHWSETAGRGTAQVRGLIWLGSCGRLSYEIYLSHMFCVFGGLALFNWIGPGGPWRFLWYPSILVVCWLPGSILSCGFTLPIERFLRRRLWSARSNAFAAPSVGDPMSMVITRFGPPDNLESPLKFAHPDYCANAHPPCSDPYFLRLWYWLPFTSLVGGHVFIVDLNEQQRVIDKGEMRSP